MIRPLRLSDLSAVMRIDQHTNTHAWNEQQWCDSLAQHRCFGLEHQAQLIGFAVCMVTLDEAELLLIAITPPLQGQAYGSVLFRALLNELATDGVNKLFLEVRASNLSAQAFYQRHQMTLSGIRKGYYPIDSGREDAQLYTLEGLA